MGRSGVSTCMTRFRNGLSALVALTLWETVALASIWSRKRLASLP